MSLRDGAMTQLRVIYAVAVRETRTRFGQHRLGYIWALVEPMMLIALFAAMSTLLQRRMPNGLTLIPFLATGFLTYHMFSHTANQGAAAISGNKALLYYPQVQTLDLVVARTALEAVTCSVAFFVIIGGHALYAGALEIGNLLTLFSGMALASLLGMGLGLLFCALSIVSTTVDRVRGPLMRPLFWCSGLFFTANELPLRVREVLLWNPVLHCVEIVRDGFFPGYHAQFASPAYVMVWILGLSFFGLTAERAFRRRLQLT